MPYQSIHEPITAYIQFNANAIKPISFVWNNNEYTNLRVNLVWSEQHGRKRRTYFGVDDGVNYFKIRCDNETLKWVLEEVG